ncbi:DUF6955 family protein [Mycobacterium sp. HUMS_1102779]|uniref:DUF6955 family protein n=1 Tax=Mycobacterium sp. HUMS_1102779 TaxID=3383487 RepID=UPI00389ACDFE
MSTTDATVKINVWINDERLNALEQAGLASLAEEAFAGMKVMPIYATQGQKDRILGQYKSAKYDSATTRSIELLPKDAKDRLLRLSIDMHSNGPEIVDRFLAEAE